MAPNQDEETRGKDSKGKEIEAGNSRRITRPPLSFLAIFNEHSIALDTSCPDQLCQQLYDGVFLKPNKLKYFVDEKSNKNCFVLFARELTVVHGDNPEYWTWMEDKETSGKDIEVAELLKICEFVLSAKYVGYMEFSLGQYDGDCKHGLVVKCAIIRPKK
ncbi:hypothetical protein RHSIM_Rhsim10G0143400 [Rhododendron simsii]|uniref:Uncharacterized protein n=1 Tax=Rhododendron simsii TaxID=118357 RepID=A0A834GG29_RHOSS|nr:hypothetical protein RHSIM_Rhsim10G0143400 [Rhododendron simsii]